MGTFCRTIRGLLVVALVVAGCGGSPTTPSSPGTPPSAPTLQRGSYYLFVSQGSNNLPVPGGGELNTWMCLGMGNYPTSVQVPVTVDGDGTSYTVRAVSGTLTLDLAVSGSMTTGTLQGRADDDTGRFSLAAGGMQGTTLSGQVTGERSASGTVSGQITLAGPEGQGGCSPANWGLTAR